MTESSELTRWLTLERIAHSDLMAVIHRGLHDGAWNSAVAMDLAEAALIGFGNGSCFFLASAVALSADRPVVGFWRKSGSEGLVHAVVHDPASGDAFDILGRRPLVSVRDELVGAVGDLRTSVLKSIDGEIDPSELEILREIAGGLPWMPVAGTTLCKRDWARLVIEYARARSPAFHRAFVDEQRPVVGA